MSDRIDEPLVLSELDMAVKTRRPMPGLIRHSDRGVQYCATQYRTVLKAHGIVQSMSRKGDCWDNAPSESFNGTLKEEFLYRQPPQSRSATRSAVFEYLEGFYNSRRLRSTLGYLSPIEYEARSITEFAGKKS